jgi:hypothetical protein
MSKLEIGQAWKRESQEVREDYANRACAHNHRRKEYETNGLAKSHDGTSKPHDDDGSLVEDLVLAPQITNTKTHVVV